MYIFPFKVMCLDHIIRYVDPREGIVFDNEAYAHTRKCQFYVASMRRCWFTIVPLSGEPLAEGDVFMDSETEEMFICRADHRGYSLVNKEGKHWPESRPLDTLLFQGSTMSLGFEKYKEYEHYIVYDGKFRYKSKTGAKFFLNQVLGVDSHGWEFAGVDGVDYATFEDTYPFASRGGYGERLFYGETVYEHYKVLGDRLYKYIHQETGKSIPTYPKDFIRKEIGIYRPKSYNNRLKKGVDEK